MKKNLLLLLTISFFVSCSSLDDGIDDFQNDLDQINAPTYLDPTLLWEEDSTGGSSGATTNSIGGNCDLGSFIYFCEEVPGVKFKITGEYYMDGSVKKIKNLSSTKVGSHPDSEVYPSLNYDPIGSDDFRVYVNYTIISRVLDYNMEWQTITTYYSDSFRVNPCGQTII